MNIIKKIKVENIKGKESLELKFDNFTANQPNIIVAPNGYGKSTIATAFKYASNGKIKINKKDLYNQDPNNHPKLEVELVGENEGTYTSTDTVGGISNKFYIYTINSSLYAKSTTKLFNGNTTATADLRVEDVIVFNNIPEKASLNYSYKTLRNQFGSQKKLFINISSMLSSYHNINLLYSINSTIKKCCNQKRIQEDFSRFLSNYTTSDTSDSIKSSISDDVIDTLAQNVNIKELFEKINKMDNKPKNWFPSDVVFTAIQICEIMKYYYDNNINILKKTNDYLQFEYIRKLLDERLELFNTTGRTIKTRRKQKKLMISFERANSMSNGERDILSFISNLTKFEMNFNKKIGILIIDEVFDYLDGSNLLAVQFYLSEMINKIKSDNKILFPIIMTHLDPQVFSNCYFNKKKIHYISSSASIDYNSDIVKLLKLRENDDLKDEIEKYYIHYHDENHLPSDELIDKMQKNFTYSSLEFKDILYNEIKQNYFLEKTYNPIMVIAGVRIRIEELVFEKLDSSKKKIFLEQHKVKNKLYFAEECGVDIPELYYLLQPLYNYGMHLVGNDASVKQRIKSSYLKTNNLHIRRMIRMLFNQQ